MIPQTLHGLPAMGVLSAMQKSIRRGMEREAMEFAVELIHTSKSFASMVGNRLEIISQEDIDTAASPHIVPFVKASVEQAKAWYDPDKLGKCRMPLGNAIRMMCRAPKSREGDHFQQAVGLRAQLTNFAPEIPDWANDHHTMAGKRQGRGVQFFLDESAKLVPEPPRNAYADEAEKMVLLRESREKESKKRLV
jgi:replication-associated recombination protein RarA